MGKYSNFSFQTLLVRPKSAIYTPKRDDEHSCHFYMKVPPHPFPNPETDGHFISFTYDADASEVTVSCPAEYSINLF